MSNDTQFFGGATATSLISGKRQFTQVGTYWGSGGYGATYGTSGSVTANTLKTLLSITNAKGEFSLLSIKNANTTSKSLRVKITIDGAVAYDSDDIIGGAVGHGKTFAGPHSLTIPALSPNIYFLNSALVEYTTSITETDGISFDYIFNLE